MCVSSLHALIAIPIDNTKKKGSFYPEKLEVNMFDGLVVLEQM